MSSMASEATRDLQLTALHKEYPNGFVAVKSLDLVIPAGSFFALLGPVRVREDHDAAHGRRA